MYISICGEKLVGKKLVNDMVHTYFDDVDSGANIIKIASNVEIMNTLHLADVVIYVTDPQCKIDLQFIHDAATNINYYFEKYKKRTQIIICMNKCDCVDYDIKNNTILLNGYHKNLFDNMVNLVNAEFKNQHPKFVLLQAEPANLTRLLNDSPVLNPDINTFDNLGIIAFGRQQWKQFLDKEKSIHLKTIKKNLAKTDIYDLKMKLYGFDELSTFIINFQNEINILAKINCITSLVSSFDFHNLKLNIDYITGLTKDCLQLIDTHKNDMSSPNNKIITLQLNILNHVYELITNKFPLDIFNKNMILEYEEIYDLLTLINKDNDNFLKSLDITNYLNILQEKCGNIFIADINNNDIDMKTIMTYIQRLRKTDFPNMDIVYNNILNSKLKINNWILQPNTVVAYFEQMHQYGIMEIDDICKHLFRLIDEKIRFIFKSSVARSDPVENPEYFAYIHLLLNYTKDLCSVKYQNNYLKLKSALYSTLVRLDSFTTDIYVLQDVTISEQNKILCLEHYLGHMIRLGSSDVSDNDDESELVEDDDTNRIDTEEFIEPDEKNADDDISGTEVDIKINKQSVIVNKPKIKNSK